MVQLYHVKIANDGNQSEFYSNPLLDKETNLIIFSLQKLLILSMYHIFCVSVTT